MAGRGHMNEVESDLQILNQRLTEYVSVGMENTIAVAEDIAEYCDDDENLKKMTQDIMKDFIGMENDIKQHVSALNHTKSVGKRSGETMNLLAIFQEKLGEIQEQDRQDLKAHPKYKEMEERMVGSGHIDEQLSSLRATLAGGTDDDEVAMTQVEINTKCPYTGRIMSNPYRNKICGHVYDLDGIMDYIKGRKHKAKCPLAGCGNSKPIVEGDLEEHRDMKKYITLLSKQSQSQR